MKDKTNRIGTVIAIAALFTGMAAKFSGFAAEEKTPDPDQVEEGPKAQKTPEPNAPGAGQEAKFQVPTGQKTEVQIPTTIEDAVGATLSEGITNLTWNFGDKPLQMTLTTNLTTNWVTLEELRPAGTNVVARQAGFIQTNRTLLLNYKGATNYPMLLDVLGRQEWPSEKRIAEVPRKK